VVSAAKMATMLGSILPKSVVLLCLFLWAKDIHKEMFPVYGRKCLPREAIHNLVEKFSQGCSKFAFDAQADVKVTEAAVRRHIRCRLIHW
jgi:hypothetical protein